MRRWSLSILLLGLAVLLGSVPVVAAEIEDYTPVTDEILKNPDPDDWIMWRRTYDLWGYSPLDQIDRDNVSQLKLAWSRAMNPGLQEAAPLVYDGIMFLHHQGNMVQALDATTGDLIWTYDRILPTVEGSYHQNQYNRTKNAIALYEDKVYLATSDAYILALDAHTGKLIWETEVADYRGGFSYTAGPVIAEGKVITGMSGCSMPGTPGGCFVTAHDAETGEELWRTHTIPRPGEAGDETWNGLPLENRFGATTWGTGSYDPELGLVYFGTGMPIPYPEVVRGTGDGDVLYSNSTLALDIDTGEIVWYFQHLPRDNWDLDHPFERILVDVEMDGEQRKVVLGAFGKTGIVWVLDRETGEFVRATETVYQNVQEIDPETGEVTINEDLVLDELGEEHFVCPSLNGGKEYISGAYNPLTQAYYVPLVNLCNDIAAMELQVRPGESLGATRLEFKAAPGSGGLIGRVDAVSAVTGEHVWSHQQRAPWSGSLITTGGELVFGGDLNRRFRAFDAWTGEVLWELPMSASVTGWPMTYMVDGRQYLAVPVGGGTLGGPAIATPEIEVVSGSNVLMVFALPEVE